MPSNLRTRPLLQISNMCWKVNEIVGSCHDTVVGFAVDCHHFLSLNWEIEKENAWMYALLLSNFTNCILTCLPTHVKTCPFAESYSRARPSLRYLAKGTGDQHWPAVAERGQFRQLGSLRATPPFGVGQGGQVSTRLRTTFSRGRK